MALKSGLQTLLLGQPSIVSLCPSQQIDGDYVDAVFVTNADQGFKPPFIVIDLTGHDPMKCLDGTYGMATSEIEIHCYGKTPAATETLSTAVATFLKDYTGAAGPRDMIDAVLWEGANDFTNSEGDGNDSWRYATTLSFSIQHRAV